MILGVFFNKLDNFTQKYIQSDFIKKNHESDACSSNTHNVICNNELDDKCNKFF